MMSFSEKLSELRKDRRINQSQLAKELGIETQNLSNYERGLYEPDFDLVVKFAKYYNVSLDYLFGLIKEEVSYDRKDSIALPKNFPEEAKTELNKFIDYLKIRYPQKP